MPKKTFLIGTFGTRGDIFPLISMAQIIKENGHVVKFITHEEYKEMCDKLGFIFYSLESIPNIEKMNSKNKDDSLKAIKSIEEHYNKVIGHVDCIISLGMFFQYSSIADKYNKKYIQVMYNTQNFSSCMYAPPIIKKQCNKKIINKFLWILYKSTVGVFQLKYINLVRKGLGLNKISSMEKYLAEKSILVNDPVLCSLPEDFLYNIPYINYLYYSSIQDEENIKDIDIILQSKAYVYIGFGSMNQYINNFNNLYIMIKILKRHNYGVILNINGIDYRKDNKNFFNIIKESDVIVVKQINHENLFKKMSIIIHHGGAGTTYTAAKCGIPQIILPFYFDQFYWGTRIHELGIGECFSEYSKLKENNFSKLLDRFSMEIYKKAAKEIKNKLNDINRKKDMYENLKKLLEEI